MATKVFSVLVNGSLAATLHFEANEGDAIETKVEDYVPFAVPAPKSEAGEREIAPVFDAVDDASGEPTP